MSDYGNNHQPVGNCQKKVSFCVSYFVCMCANSSKEQKRPAVGIVPGDGWMDGARVIMGGLMTLLIELDYF